MIPHWVKLYSHREPSHCEVSLEVMILHWVKLYSRRKPGHCEVSLAVMILHWVKLYSCREPGHCEVGLAMMITHWVQLYSHRELIWSLIQVVLLQDTAITHCWNDWKSYKHGALATPLQCQSDALLLKSTCRNGEQSLETCLFFSGMITLFIFPHINLPIHTLCSLCSFFTNQMDQGLLINQILICSSSNSSHYSHSNTQFKLTPLTAKCNSLPTFLCSADSRSSNHHDLQQGDTLFSSSLSSFPLVPNARIEIMAATATQLQQSILCHKIIYETLITAKCKGMFLDNQPHQFWFFLIFHPPPPGFDDDQ